MNAAGPAVVIGLGNVLLRDDGVGVRVVEALRRLSDHDPAALPVGTRLVDGGTLGLDLLHTLDGARSVVLLDAVNLDQDVGTVSVLRGDAIADAGGPGAGTSLRGVGELLSVARLMGWLPERVSLVGVQVEDTGFGVGLSPRVDEAVKSAVETARTELRALDELVAAARSEKPGTRQHGEASA
jgi:hydrogenase maturation protease